MIVKDSTANQVHDGLKHENKKRIKSRCFRASYQPQDPCSKERQYEPLQLKDLTNKRWRATLHQGAL